MSRLRSDHISRLAFWATCLAFCVICLGSYTRLTDSGLGCPDWPGCYGHLIAPTQIQGQSGVQPRKAWTEMVHRYIAGTLATLVLVIVSACAYLGWRDHQREWWVLAVLVCCLVLYQALLGRWTVTMKLWPIVVMQHLMGGYLLAVLLWWMSRRLGAVPPLWLGAQVGATRLKRGRFLLVIGVILLLGQIALGAWTSTNYASLSCPGFPFCEAHRPWPHAFHQAFHYLKGGAINYDGGVLSEEARGTIQMVHRAGALLVGTYWMVVLIWCAYQPVVSRVCQKPLLCVCFCVIAQITLGILNVLWQLPRPIAVLHTVFAALFLLSVVQLLSLWWPPVRLSRSV